MSTFKKHVGRIKNTDRRCVVVYMQIPGKDDYALIVDTDALPDRFHDALMSIIDSTEGQQTPHLHNLLSRRILPDTGFDMMNALHSYGFLRPVEIDNVVMYPAPNAPCPLRTIIDFMKSQESGEPMVEKQELENRHLENQKVEANQSQVDIAKNILLQAADLEAEAARKREQAYRLVPALRPTSEATPIAESATTPPVSPSPDVTEASEFAFEPTASNIEATDDSRQFSVDVGDLPPEVAESFISALKEQFSQAGAETEESEESEESEETQGNQVDTSDEAIQAFLDKVALREDMADREKWEAMQPKKPVGRPRKDGLPAGTKPEAVPPPPKKRGRPPKAKK